MTADTNGSERRNRDFRYSSRILLAYADSLIQRIYSTESQLRAVMPLLREDFPQAHRDFLEIGEGIVDNIQEIQKTYGVLMRRKDASEFITHYSYHMEDAVGVLNDSLKSYGHIYGKRLAEYKLKSRLNRLKTKIRNIKKPKNTKGSIYF